MISVLALFGIGGNESLLIIAVLLLFFGASKLPKLARSMGASVGEFKKGLKEGNEADAAKPDGAAEEKK